MFGQYNKIYPTDPTGYAYGVEIILILRLLKAAKVTGKELQLRYTDNNTDY